MIEIDLSSGRGDGDKLNVGGFDLSYLNVKMLLIGIVFLYLPEALLQSYYDGEVEGLNKKELSIRKAVRKTTSKVKELDSIRKQVEALKQQETKLSERLKTVKVIINKRQNPFKIFHYVAESIPTNVWLTSLKMEDRRLVLKGHAENWKDIGTFLEALKNSIFLSNLEYKVPENAKTEYDGRKVEVFEITSNITRFE